MDEFNKKYIEYESDGINKYPSKLFHSLNILIKFINFPNILMKFINFPNLSVKFAKNEIYPYLKGTKKI